MSDESNKNYYWLRFKPVPERQIIRRKIYRGNLLSTLKESMGNDTNCFVIIVKVTMKIQRRIENPTRHLRWRFSRK